MNFKKIADTSFNDTPMEELALYGIQHKNLLK